MTIKITQKNNLKSNNGVFTIKKMEVIRTSDIKFTYLNTELNQQWNSDCYMMKGNDKQFFILNDYYLSSFSKEELQQFLERGILFTLSMVGLSFDNGMVSIRVNNEKETDLPSNFYVPIGTINSVVANRFNVIPSFIDKLMLKMLIESTLKGKDVNSKFEEETVSSVELLRIKEKAYAIPHYSTNTQTVKSQFQQVKANTYNGQRTMLQVYNDITNQGIYDFSVLNPEEEILRLSEEDYDALAEMVAEFNRAMKLNLVERDYLRFKQFYTKDELDAITDAEYNDLVAEFEEDEILDMDDFDVAFDKFANGDGVWNK